MEQCAKLSRFARRWGYCLLTVILFTVPAQAEVVIGDGPIDFVFLAEGYQQHEKDIFEAKVSEAVATMLNTEPYASHVDRFTFHREFVASEESGADDPANGIFVDTFFKATYGYGGVQRCLFAPPHTVRPFLRTLPYEADITVVMVNDNGTGGCTSSGYATISNQPKYIKSMLHELGHVIAGLGDEVVKSDDTYTGGEPDKPNLTINPDPTTVKWRHLIKPGNGVGVFEGGLYVAHGIYRPMEVSLMGALEAEYGPVNEYYLEQAIIEMAGNVPQPDMDTCNGLKCTIIGTDGDDKLRGGWGSEVICGKGGDDDIRGKFKDDVICGGPGDDYIDGLFGNDILIGGPGNDTFKESFGDDTCDGGDGVDTVKYGRSCETMVDME